MRCKLQLHEKDICRFTGNVRVRFGAVWEGSKEAQEQSENAIFGAATPAAYFEASIANHEAVEGMGIGDYFYVDFTKIVFPKFVLHSEESGDRGVSLEEATAMLTQVYGYEVALMKRKAMFDGELQRVSINDDMLLIANFG